MLKFIALSGTTDVTQNLYVYEYENEMIVVDCGVGFPESEMYGVDLVIPDMTYIKDNKDKLKGIFITHGHEDHIGALPFLLKNIKTQIYATKLTAGFIEDKLADYKIRDVNVQVIDPVKDVVSLGSFTITPFRVSHSVPDAVGYAIDTPEGRVFHIPDYKFDWTPVDGRPFDIARASLLASGGVLALASDSLGATTPGYTESEREIETRIESIVEKATGQVFFTTISSNISRMQQALSVADRLGRKTTFIGRSIERKAEIARNLGYLYYPKNLNISPKKLKNLPARKRMYIISGSYGQPGSALYRAALGEHDFLKIEEGDTVIFSSDPAPPGSKTNVDFVVDKLIESKVDVHYYDLQEDLHVSGHGSQEDIRMLFALIRPKYFMPIGGTVRHNRAYKDIANSINIESSRVFELKSGDILEFNQGNAKVSGNIPTKEVLVDGLGVGDVGNVVLRDRQHLSTDGIAIALIQVDRIAGGLISPPEIFSRGFVYQAQMKDLLQDAGRELKNRLEKRDKIEKREARFVAIDFLEKYFYEKTGRRPMILPLIVEV
jgi:ribonuclease J